ncbi:MAG: hypothetical protein A2Y10_11905 [Planctomycetes bacterium GWF2_41_51]|nr:MAG: hypothetical protein A2Y10_11905 [Planctomycetes bacterium GWF2_41_51]HBG28649.1 hypothetical protein [Phycisphaerales bacterium]
MKLKNVLLVSALSFVFVGSSFAKENNSDTNTISKACNNADNFQFIIMGDRTGKEQKGVFSEILQKVNSMRPEFVLSVGDNIQGYTEDVNALNAQWDEFESMISLLDMPFINVAGNHDVTNKVEKEIFNKRYGKPYFHKIYKDVLFLFIDTQDTTLELTPEISAELDKENKKLKNMIKTQGYTPETMEFFEKYEAKQRQYNGGKISDEQFNYFKDVLEKNKNIRWTFVLLHKPIWKEEVPPKAWTDLEKLLSLKPHTVIAGHEHRHQYEVKNNHDYIIMGTCGGGWVWPKTLTGVYHHILWITMDGSKPLITNIYTNGIMEKSDIRPYQHSVLAAPEVNENGK